MGVNNSIEDLPKGCKFDYGYAYLETDKRIYYPGDIIEGCVNLIISSPLVNVGSLQIRFKGKESFKFVTRNQKVEPSSRNSRLFSNTLHNLH